MLTIIEYLVLALFTVLLSIELSKCVDALDKKTNLSGAFIGGVMLAAVTSLPELFTSLTAVLYLHKPQLIQGNVLGSNIFNLTIFALVLILFTKAYKRSQIAKSQKTLLYFCIVMFLCVIYALFHQVEVSLGISQVHLMSIVMIILYIFSTIMAKDDNSVESGEDDVDMSLKQAIVRFIVFAVLLVIVSILLTQVSDQLSAQLHLGATVAGAIFLGVATSLPELSSSLSLAKMGNFNASIANVVGSCVFNFTILCFADLIYAGGGIYGYDYQALIFSIFGIVSCVLTIFSLKQQLSVKWLRLLGICIMLSYVASVVLSM
ncbi:MAG: sodium:calcium antiporter [Erysipelotrichia bacterium]|nr:sodium:calcium antiporter [Erysipelotrichia bacterium]NCC54778.1 sodium:calcium antiporter [Erysipelotrichia bacterium]